MKVIIAEKPIAAKNIAEILGAYKTLRQDNVEYYALDDSLIVPLKGHVLDVDFSQEYNNWQNTKLTDLVDGKIQYKPTLPAVRKILEKNANTELLIIATDYDREGESIGKEAIDIVKRKNPAVKVKRAKFSSFSPQEVKQAFSKLSEFDYNLADAADSRREIDLIWGAVLTRYISLTSHRLGSSFLSVGRVQTPALALVVDREKEILAFKPEDYWAVSIACEKNKQEFTAYYEEERLFDKEKAEKIASLKDTKAIVESVEKKEFKTLPPTPFNTTEFLRAAASVGTQPKKAMNIAEKLYMDGLISYPRTDNTYYPETLDIRKTVEKISEMKEFNALAEKILAKKKITPTHGKKKATDHPPIHPVENASKAKLNDAEWKIYELIIRRFLATLSDPAEVEVITAKLDYCGEPFYTKGKTILKEGWREFYHYSKVEEIILPELSEKEKVKVNGIQNEQKQTKPKPRYSPAALIKLMDELNLGTKSTRHDILQKLIDRGYIQGMQNFTPSQVAFAVIDMLEKYSQEITTPTMTSELEKEMDLVEQGGKKKEDVVSDSRLMLHKVLAKLEKNTDTIKQGLQTAMREDTILSKCTQCGGELRIISTRRGTRFVGCSGYKEGCKNSFPLPAKGKITILNKNCPECTLPVISVWYKGRRPFEMCINHKCKSKENWGKKKKEEEEKKTEESPEKKTEKIPEKKKTTRKKPLRKVK